MAEVERKLAGINGKTTRSCFSRPISGHIGALSTLAAASSVARAFGYTASRNTLRVLRDE